MTKKILCAVDDSENAEKTAALAAELAGKSGAELTLFAVREQLDGYGAKGSIGEYLWDEAQLKSVLDKAAGAAKKAGCASPKTASASSRDVARAIVMHAEDNGVDHIVVGSGGKGGIARFVMGSVSHDVVNRAHCPVTIVR